MTITVKTGQTSFDPPKIYSLKLANTRTRTQHMECRQTYRQADERTNERIDR